MKRLVSLMLSVLLLAGLLAGAGVAVAEAPVEISILMAGDNTPSPDNSVLREIEKRTGIKLNVIYTPVAEYSSKLSTLVAAKNIPDIIKVTSSVSDAQQFVDNGFVIDIAPYLQQYGQNILEQTGDLLNVSPLNKDGKVFALISAFLPYPSSLSIRTDWLANLGLSMPTDLDSLYNVLKAFTENDPDQNGVKDTYGLGASIDGSWRNFAAIFAAYGIPAGTNTSVPVQLADGTVTTSMKHPNWLAAVKYIRKLYQEGLMDQDFATLPRMSSFEKLWNGTVGAYDFQCVGTTNNWMPGRYTQTPVPTFDFAIIEGPGGRGGSEAQYPEYKNSIMISSTCKNPEAAVKLLDFFMSEEGDELLYLGVEGVHYRWVDEANGVYEKIAPYNDSQTQRNDGGYVYWEFYRRADHVERRTFNEQTRKGLELAYANVIDYPYIILPFEAATTYGTTLRDIEKEAFCQLVVSTGDVDQEYAEYVSRWENEGGLDWEQEATAAYQQQQNQ